MYKLLFLALSRCKEASSGASLDFFPALTKQLRGFPAKENTPTIFANVPVWV